MTKTKKKKELDTDLLRVKPKNPNKELKFILPLGVSINKLYSFFKGKHTMTSAGHKYIRDVVPVLENAIAHQEWDMAKKGEWCIVKPTYYFPDRKKRDSHNYIKLMMDVLEGLVFENDQFTIVQEQYVYLDRDFPRIEITVEFLEVRE